MRLRVGTVGKLTGEEASRNLFCQLLCFGNGTFHSFASVSQDKLGAVGF